MKRLAIIAGVVFIAIGILGFVPALTPDGKLLGVFAVDAMHNMVHIGSGILALVLGMAGEAQGRLYFRILAIVYGLVTLLGFVAGRDGELMGMAHNMADLGLHLVITLVAAYLGFFHARALPGRGQDLRGV